MDIQEMLAAREDALKRSVGGPPKPTSNPFYGVGPITDAVPDEAQARANRFAFDRWLEENYRKVTDTGGDAGPFTVAEVSRSMHRGYPADKFILDMMRAIHGYFGFPKSNRMAVGLGGGHSGFSVTAFHLITAADSSQQIFIDTPRPESEGGKAGGFFRQSWGAQITELMRLSKGSDEARLHFASDEGHIPGADELRAMGVKLFFGVGHETTGATTYSESDIKNLLAWIDSDPEHHHAVLDATSMLGAMPWEKEIVSAALTKCCFFMPFQKAIGGISGYFVISFTPQALALVEANQKEPGFAIPRQLKLATPVDQKKPLSGERTVNIGPFYDPQTDKMLGGVINTFSTLAFAETTFGLKQMEKRCGSVDNLNRRSVNNRALINSWISQNDRLELGVTDATRRGAAVTLLKVKDKSINDPALHARIIARSKQLLAYEGVTHPDGSREKGLDVARYINAFPGTPGDYRAWMGGIREESDITALLENISYAYERAKIVVLEEELAKAGHHFKSQAASRKDVKLTEPVKILICDLVGLKFGKNKKPDHSEVKAHVEAKGGVFFDRAWKPADKLTPGKLHFFYVPEISTEAEILPLTKDGQYDAVIAAATHLPKESKFRFGGVRIGTGTGNMACACWGGGNGTGGEAPLMNTPSFNTRATAQMAMKALLRVLPDLATDELHKRSVAGRFDTGKHLKEFPTEKLEGKTIAIIGYGNIGRELAKLASAFHMKVKVHARPRHKEWIESEGFIFCATEEEAAMGADVLSIHTGLGPYDAKAKRFANEGEVNFEVLKRLNKGSVVLNYDRGECVDAKDLDKAMKSGIVRFAAIDADIFKDKKGKLTGPLVPYLPLAKKYKGRVELLPHAAADTEHVSRVEGAKQAVDQIFDCVLRKRLTNLKGTAPEGYSVAGARTVAGVGRVVADDVARIDNKAMNELRALSETMAGIWGAMSATDADGRAELSKRHGKKLLLSANRYASLLKELGIEGPFEG
jgi:lactate dehydrogenase-like 2-hydroxyacid dehydrogenase/phosphoserine aminotransferase